MVEKAITPTSDDVSEMLSVCPSTPPCTGSLCTCTDPRFPIAG